MVALSIKGRLSVDPELLFVFQASTELREATQPLAGMQRFRATTRRLVPRA